jgi:hypothetical protein
VFNSTQSRPVGAEEFRRNRWGCQRAPGTNQERLCWRREGAKESPQKDRCGCERAPAASQERLCQGP